MPVKLHFQLLVLALVALLAYEALTRAGHNQDSGKEQLPEILFYGKSGNAVSLDDFGGRVVLVNLWASWCLPCVVELPALSRLQQKWPAEKFRVVAISMDRSSLEEIRGFLDSRGAKSLEAYWDRERQIPLKWKYEGLPTSFLLDKNGAVVKRYDGPYAWDTDLALLKEIGALLP